MNNQRRLGRGLEALLGRPLDEPAGPAAANASPGLVELPVYDILPNAFQPRQDFDPAEIESLADSLRRHGILQPIVVRRRGDRYELISGERRLRAAQLAGWERIPAQVREADDRQVAELAIVENLQRKDLNPLEKAASFERYLRQYGCTQEELAARIQIDRSTIANLIRLLELPAPVQDSLRRGELGMGHARALLPLGDEREQVEFCRRIVAEQLSVRATEELVQEAIRRADAQPLAIVPGPGTSAPSGGRNSKTRSRHTAALEQELRSVLGAKVQIHQAPRGGGRIVVHFTNHDEFERLWALLSGQSARQVG